MQHKELDHGLSSTCDSECHSYAQLSKNPLTMTRRFFLGKAATGLGGMALASLLNKNLFAAESTSNGLPGIPHFAPKAKRVIYLFMSGGPSHHDLWDYKPKMQEMFGKQLPDKIRDGQRVTGMTARQKNGFPIVFRSFQ